MLLAILFIIALAAGIIGLIVAFNPKKETEIETQPLITSTPIEESIPSIHDEIAKTVEAIKSQVPIEEPKKKTVKKTTKPKTTKESPKMSAKKITKTTTKKTTKK